MAQKAGCTAARRRSPPSDTQAAIPICVIWLARGRTLSRTAFSARCEAAAEIPERRKAPAGRVLSQVQRLRDRRCRDASLARHHLAVCHVSGDSSASFVEAFDLATETQQLRVERFTIHPERTFLSACLSALPVPAIANAGSAVELYYR